MWRVLRVTFPDYITSHTRVQRAYYGPDGLPRRHQYVVDDLGGAQTVNWFGSQEFDMEGQNLKGWRDVTNLWATQE